MAVKMPSEFTDGFRQLNYQEILFADVLSFYALSFCTLCKVRANFNALRIEDWSECDLTAYLGKKEILIRL